MTLIENRKLKWPEQGFQTTGIGSLPHPNVDSALGFAFQTDIPFLPQIPMRNYREYMVPQALEGLPGLIIQDDGSVHLNLEGWLSREHFLDQALQDAFRRADTDPRAFTDFEPTRESYSSWQPFLWEIQERRAPMAKAQLAGPLTCQWTLKMSPDWDAGLRGKISHQILQLVLARSIAICRRLRNAGATPIFFFDEPALYAWNDPTHRFSLGIRELGLCIQSLKIEKAWVGVHCCSDTDWPQVLRLGMDFLSLDTSLSLPRLLAHAEDIRTYVNSGGRFAMGVIPTSGKQGPLDIDSRSWSKEVVTRFRESGIFNREDLDRLFKQSLYTPACGLALHPVSDADHYLGALSRAAQDVRELCLS